MPRPPMLLVCSDFFPGWKKWLESKKEKPTETGSQCFPPGPILPQQPQSCAESLFKDQIDQLPHQAQKQAWWGEGRNSHRGPEPRSLDKERVSRQIQGSGFSRSECPTRHGCSYTQMMCHVSEIHLAWHPVCVFAHLAHVTHLPSTGG